MTILSLSRFMPASVLSANLNASTIPGFWQQGYGQGNTEHSVTETSGKTFTTDCTGNPDQNSFYQHSVFLTLTGDKVVSLHNNDATITVVMDHQQCIIPSSLGWRNDDNTRFDFISNISETGQFDVYVNDHKARTSTVNQKNAEKVLSTLRDCSNSRQQYLPQQTHPDSQQAAGVFFYQEPENDPIRVATTRAFHPEANANGHYHARQRHTRGRPGQLLPSGGP